MESQNRDEDVDLSMITDDENREWELQLFIRPC